MRRRLDTSSLAYICILLTAESLVIGAEPAKTTTATDKSFNTVAADGTVKFKPSRVEPTVPKQFRQKTHSFTFKTQFVRFSGPVRVFKVRFPSPIRTNVPENNVVHGHYFQPTGGGPYPGVVVLHILGGEFALSQMIANALARRRIAALFIKMPYYGERRGKNSSRRMISRIPKETVAGMTQAVFDIRRAAAWLADRPEVDVDQLGVTGISLGGIMSALSAAAEPRFGKVAIYLGGGKLAEAIWENPHPDAEKFRKDWLAADGTRQSFVKRLAPVDPATYGHLLKSRKVLMVAAKNDQIIPPPCTLALWKSIGDKPELVWLESGHITAVQYLLGEVRRLENFFKRDKPTTKSQNHLKADKANKTQ